jgi:hypothetical protein
MLERLESSLRLLILGEGVTPQEAREGRRDEAVLLDELPVVTRQA